MTRVAWTPPASGAEGEIRLRELTSQVGEIEAQLADRDRVTIEGRRLSPREYHGWRKRAIGALMAKQAERRALRAWLRTQRPARTADADWQRAFFLCMQPTGAEAIRARFAAGDSVSHLAWDFGLPEAAVQAVCERTDFYGAPDPAVEASA